MPLVPPPRLPSPPHNPLHRGGKTVCGCLAMGRAEVPLFVGVLGLPDRHVGSTGACSPNVCALLRLWPPIGRGPGLGASLDSGGRQDGARGSLDSQTGSNVHQNQACPSRPQRNDPVSNSTRSTNTSSRVQGPDFWRGWLACLLNGGPSRDALEEGGRYHPPGCPAYAQPLSP